MNIELRNNRNDAYIIDFVINKNCYCLPDNMTGMNVMDIGANIGAFSLAAASRGAFVWAFEPEPENFNLLLINTEGMPVQKHCMAIGNPGERKLYGKYSNASLIKEDDNSCIVKTISLKEAVSDIVFDLIKLNCEGSEYEIIPEIEQLKPQIKKVIIEFHDGFKSMSGYSISKQLNRFVYEFTSNDNG